MEEGTFAVDFKSMACRAPWHRGRICYSWSGRSLSKGFSGGRGQVPRGGVQTSFWGAVEDWDSPWAEKRPDGPLCRGQSLDAPGGVWERAGPARAGADARAVAGLTTFSTLRSLPVALGEAARIS